MYQAQKMNGHVYVYLRGINFNFVSTQIMNLNKKYQAWNMSSHVYVY